MQDYLFNPAAPPIGNSKGSTTETEDDEVQEIPRPTADDTGSATEPESEDEGVIYLPPPAPPIPKHLAWIKDQRDRAAAATLNYGNTEQDSDYLPVSSPGRLPMRADTPFTEYYQEERYSDDAGDLKAYLDTTTEKQDINDYHVNHDETVQSRFGSCANDKIANERPHLSPNHNAHKDQSKEQNSDAAEAMLQQGISVTKSENDDGTLVLAIRIDHQCKQGDTVLSLTIKSGSCTCRKRKALGLENEEEEEEDVKLKRKRLVSSVE